MNQYVNTIETHQLLNVTSSTPSMHMPFLTQKTQYPFVLLSSCTPNERPQIQISNDIRLT